MSTEQQREDERKILDKTEKALNAFLQDDLKWINAQQLPDDRRRSARSMADRLNEGLADAGVDDYRVSVQLSPARIVLDQVSEAS